MDTKAMEKHIEEVLNNKGLLLLNSNKYLQSIIGEGGTWETAMSLIDKKKVFYSKVYKNRVTYLSTEIYYCLKDFRQSSLITEDEQMVIELLESANGMTTKVIKEVLPIGSDRVKKAIDSLCKKLLITVIKPGKKINDTWSEVEWGTYEQWEEEASLTFSYSEEDKKNIILSKLKGSLSEKEIEKLMA